MPGALCLQILVPGPFVLLHQRQEVRELVSDLRGHTVSSHLIVETGYRLTKQDRIRASGLPRENSVVQRLKD